MDEHRHANGSALVAAVEQVMASGLVRVSCPNQPHAPVFAHLFDVDQA